MPEPVCPKCGPALAGTGYTTKQKGPHIGAYCSRCNAWLKWLPKGSVPRTFGAESRTQELSTAGRNPLISESTHPEECPF